MSDDRLGNLRAEIARESRRTGDQSRLDDLRRAYAEAKLDDYIRRIFAAFPPLTEDQRARLTALLSPDDLDAA
jgi:hypothetical protein